MFLKYKILHIRKALAVSLAIMAVGIVIAAYFSTSSIARAAHGTGPTAPSGLLSSGISGKNVCNGGEALGSRGSTAGTSGTGSAFGGLYVPVKDFEAESYLRSIALNIRAIEGDTRLIERDTQAIRYYLRALCEKEYVHDHTIQHAWADLIGKFVQETQSWINRGYYGNPLFMTNQHIYEQLVNLQVTRVLLLEIKESAIDEPAKFKITQAIVGQLYDTAWPYKGERGLLAPADVPAALAEDFDGAGSYLRWSYNLAHPEDSTEGLLSMIREELKNRKKKQIDFEEQKLAWGRGFFSYELCDLAIYTLLEEDRRNCRIATPGSLIQDLSATVFGSAIRQMELNDEYEEWIAPNTVAVLNDILSARGLNDDQSRGLFNSNAPPIIVNPYGSPTRLPQVVDIDIGSQNDELPREFQVVIETELENVGEGTGPLIQGIVGDYLNPEELYPEQ